MLEALRATCVIYKALERCKSMLRPARSLCTLNLSNPMFFEMVKVFPLTDNPDLVVTRANYNYLIRRAVSNSLYGDAAALMNEMRLVKITPTTDTYNSFIKGCMVANRIDIAQNMLKQLEIRDNCSPDTSLYNTLILLYSRHGKTDECYNYYVKMRENKEKPDHLTFFAIYHSLHNISSSNVLDFIESTEECFGISPNLHYINGILRKYANVAPVRALQLFDMLKSKGHKFDVFSYNAILDVCSQQSTISLAVEYFQFMQNEDIEMDEMTVCAIIRNILDIDDPENALKLLDLANNGKSSYEAIATILHTISNLYTEQCVDEIQEIYRSIQRNVQKPPIRMYECLIKHYVSRGDLDAAGDVADRAKEEDPSNSDWILKIIMGINLLQPPEEQEVPKNETNTVTNTISPLLRSILQAHNLAEAKRMLTYMSRKGVEPEEQMWKLIQKFPEVNQHAESLFRKE